jgi:hypothetical protein
MNFIYTSNDINFRYTYLTSSEFRKLSEYLNMFSKILNEFMKKYSFLIPHNNFKLSFDRTNIIYSFDCMYYTNDLKEKRYNIPIEILVIYSLVGKLKDFKLNDDLEKELIKYIIDNNYIAKLIYNECNIDSLYILSEKIGRNEFFEIFKNFDLNKLANYYIKLRETEFENTLNEYKNDIDRNVFIEVFIKKYLQIKLGKMT